MEEGGQEVAEGEGEGEKGVLGPSKANGEESLPCLLPGARPTATKEDQGAWTSPVMSSSRY